MSELISFLEDLGQGARLDDEAYAAAVATLPVDEASRAALLARDPAALARLLGGRSNVLSLLVPAEDDQPKDDEDEESPDDDRETQVRAA